MRSGDRTASRLLRLVELTRAHPNFGLFFGLAGLGEGRRRSRAAATPDTDTFQALQAEDVLVAMDCEMVSTDLEEDALARVCVCNARGELLLDRLVRPPGKVTDARSSITGIETKDLEVDYRLEDAQADILGLIHPLTVVVGHTLHKDLDVLRLDAPLVLDISLLQLVIIPRTLRAGFSEQDAVEALEFVIDRSSGACCSCLPTPGMESRVNQSGDPHWHSWCSTSLVRTTSVPRARTIVPRMCS